MALGVIPPLCATLGPVLAGPEGCSRGRWRSGLSLLLWGLRRLFPGWLTLAAALVCFIGMGLLTSDLSGPMNLGDILTIISTFMFAGQIISIGHYAACGDPIVQIGRAHV